MSAPIGSDQLPVSTRAHTQVRPYEDMGFDPQKHSRRSVRLPGYDYGQPGEYFVTLCTHRMRCLFGQVKKGQMHLNEAGQMVEKWWFQLSEKFAAVRLDESVVMPNHFHGIIIIIVGVTHPGAPLQEIVQWFKTMTTNEYIRGVNSRDWSVFPGRFWQRNYYERVIRDEQELDHAREYIRANPPQWELDRYNPSRTG